MPVSPLLRMASASLGASLVLSCSVLFPIGDDYSGAPDAGAVDGRADSAVDAGGGDGGGDGAPLHTVYCVGQSCDTATSFCCVNQCTGTAGSCRPLDQTATCTGCDVPLLCDDGLDCANVGSDAVCCAALDSDTTASRVSCQALIDCQRTRHLVLCDPRQPTPCPNGAACESISAPSKFVSGYICKDL